MRPDPDEIAGGSLVRVGPWNDLGSAALSSHWNSTETPALAV